jgi:hypothetical protein
MYLSESFVAVAFPHPTFLSGSGAARLTATVALSFTLVVSTRRISGDLPVATISRKKTIPQFEKF